MSHTKNVKTFLNRLEKLNSQAGTLKEQRDALNLDSRKWANRRNALNFKKSEVGKELKIHREKRDEANEVVKRCKNLRLDLIAQSKTKREKYFILMEKVNEILCRTSRSFNSVKNQIETLDWEIQTNPLSSVEEKEVIEKIRLLEKQLLIHKEAKSLKDKLVELRTELGVLKIQSNEIHSQKDEGVNKSQEYHKKMFEKTGEVQALKEKADDAHRRSLEFRNAANETHRKYLDLIEQIRKLEGNIKEIEDAEYKERAIRHTKTAIETASKKLKERRKLTLEEFKLLKEKEFI